MIPHTTQDLTLAAYLMTSGCVLNAMTITGRLATFTFNSVSPDALEEYTSGQASVEPLAFHSNIKRLSLGIKEKSR